MLSASAGEVIAGKPLRVAPSFPMATDTSNTKTTIDQDRIAEFEEVMLGWIEADRPGVPLLTLPDAPLAKAGMCLSCGTAIEPWRWRCEPCLEAVNRVITEFRP